MRGLIACAVLLTLGLLVACGGGEEPAARSEGAVGGSDPSATRPPTTVEAVAAWRGDATAWVIGEGTARAIEREYLTFEQAGKISYIEPGLRVGSRVRAGEVLARQDQRRVSADVTRSRAGVSEATTQLGVAQAELEQAQTEYEVAATDEARYRVLIEKNSASPQEYDQAKARLAQAEAAVRRARNRVAAAESQIESAKASLEQTLVAEEETEIRSPIDGIVAYLNIEEGIYFTPSVVRTDTEQSALSTVPIVVIDPDRYEVTVEVPAYHRGRVAQGQRAILLLSDEFSQAALGRMEKGRAEKVLPIEVADDLKAYGEVYSVNPTVSPAGRSVTVEVRTTQGAERLQDGVFVTAWIATEAHTDTVLVPMSSLIYRENRPYVFVAADGRVEQREIQVGLQDFTAQEVVGGVSVGEMVVTEGRFQLTEGAPVRVLDPDAAAGGSR